MTYALYFNGIIHTMDDNNSQVEAVLTKDDLIYAVGSQADLRAIPCEPICEYDLQGQTLLPAFIDPHGHFPDTGFIALFRVDLSPPPRGDCPNIATALKRLKHQADNTPEGEWIMGVLFDNLTNQDGRMPSRAELDSVSTHHPIWVLHASGHNGVANSMALTKAGITKTTANPLGGRYAKDEKTGELTGLIEGLSAMKAMGDTNFLIDKARFWQGFYTARDEYIRHGITFAQNAWSSMETLENFATLPADEDPGIDLMLLPIGEEEPQMTDTLDWPDNPHLRLGPRKLFTDGAFQLQTAWLSQPYYHVMDSNFPSGMPYCLPEEHQYQVKRLHKAGYQIHCHCNGDLGAQLFIDAVAEALKDNPREDHRHTMIHAQTLRDDQLAQMAELGISVSFFSAHIYFWGDLHHDVLLGAERAKRLSPAGSAERAGVRYTIHNDASVTPSRPLHLAHCAVNRRSASGRELNEDQNISVMSALRAQTIDAAWQVFVEDERGSIEPNKVADFVILDRDPVQNSDVLDQIQVKITIRRGVAITRDS